MKYKYATTRRNKNSLASFIGNKKHRCKKLLNSKNLVAGLITVVGSMLMMAQSEAAPIQVGWAPAGGAPYNGVWDHPVLTNWSSPPGPVGTLTWGPNISSLNPAGDIQAFFNLVGGGAVTVTATGVSVGEVNFGASGYTVGGPGTLTLASLNPLIDVSGNGDVWLGAQNGVTGIINANLDYTTALNPGGTLVINGNPAGGSGSIYLGGSNNANTAGVLVNRGLLRTSNGSALGDTSAVTVANGATLQLFVNSETIGSLNSVDTNPVTSTAVVDLLGVAKNLTLSGNANGNFAGTITGGPATGLIKNGESTQILSGNNTYAGQTTINNGIIHARNSGALGTAVGGTTINGDGQLQYDLTPGGAGITIADAISVNYGGTTGTIQTALLHNGSATRTIATQASLHQLAGFANTQSGNVTMVGDQLRIASSAGRLLVSGTIFGNFAALDDVVTVDSSTGIVDLRDIDNTVEFLHKTGSGMLQLHNAAPGLINHNRATIIQEGTVSVARADQLGATRRVGFIGDSRLFINSNPDPGVFNSVKVDLIGRGSPVVGTVDVFNGKTANFDFVRVESDTATNVFRKAGLGTLNLAINPADVVGLPAPPANFCSYVPGTGLVFGTPPGTGATGAILDPAAGVLTINNTGNPAVVVEVNGLGNTTAPANSTGTLNVLNADLYINNTGTPTFFGGTLNLAGNLGLTGEVTLTGSNTGFMGQTTVTPGAVVRIGHNNALGAFGNYSTNGTRVCEGGTLALFGGITTQERITLFNSASLINDAAGGTNTVAQMVLIEHDPLQLPNSPIAHIGSHAGTLRLNGGIEDHNTDPDMSLGLNTMAADVATVDVNSSIGASVQDVTLGNAANANATVILGANNLYSGNTIINGGNVVVGNALSLSGSDVTVAGAANLDSNGNVAIANDIHLNATLTTGAAGNTLVLNGQINGAGGLTNAGGNTTLGVDNGYFGNTSVTGGTLTLVGALTSSPLVSVSDGGTLKLFQPERIADFATLTSSGVVTLNGTETVMTYNQSGVNSVLNGTGLLNAGTYNLSDGATTNAGANMGAGILNIAGALPVTLNGDSAAETVNVNSGTLNLNGELTDVTELNISPGAPAATVNLGASERINDPAVVNVFTGGALNLGGTETIKTLNSSGTLGGAGTLITTGNTINLNNGHVSLANTMLQNLNGPNPQLLSNGTVNINGANNQNVANNARINVGTAVIQTGTMFLNGLFINNGSLTIDSGAALVSGFGDRIANGATVNNNGTWTLGGNDTIGTYNANGGALNAAGTLTASSYNLSNGASTAVNANLGTGVLNSGPGTVTLNGNSAASDVNVLSGLLNLNGQLTNVGNSAVNNLTISNGATLVSGSSNRVNNTARVDIVTGGTWTLGGSDTIGTFNSGGLLNGSGHLNATSYNLTHGAVTATNAHLGDGTVNSNGTVTLNGHTDAEFVNVYSGQLNLATAGRLNDPTVRVFVDDDATLNLGGNENIDRLTLEGILRDNGGASSLLTANRYDLVGGTTWAGANLGTGDLNSTGSSALWGNTNADTIDIDGGVLTTEGAVQNANGVITVDQFASWNVNNTNFTYARLQGEGTVDAYTIGTFVNENTVAPGQFNGDIGELNIGGNYRENDTLEIEFNTGASDFFNHDVLDVAGYVTLNSAHSILDLEEVGAFNADNIQCGERFHIIDSYGTINGAWSSIGGSTILANQTFGTQVLFDLGSGDVVGTGLAQFETIADIPNIDSNQLAVLTAITDSAIDTVGNYDSSDAGTGNVLDHILQACDVGGNAGKLAAINSTMPEGYAGAADYALHATRSYTETIMQTTPFGASAGSVEYDEKGQVTSSTAGGGHSLQAFGGYHSMELASDSSNNGHDYDMDSSGGYAGVRAMAGDKLTYGAFVGVDSGSVDAAALNLDADGYVIGALAHYQASDKIGVWANLSYGSFSFDGHRRVFGSNLTVKEFDADAFQVGVGADYEAYNSNGFKVAPGLGLRFIDASTDSITETGGPAALNISGIDADALLLDLTVKFSYMPEGGNYGVTGYIGYQHDFQDGDRDVDAMFASGSPYFRVNAPGLGDSAFTYGIGGYYDFTEDLRFSVNYRGESRSDADEMHSIDLRLTYGF